MRIPPPASLLRVVAALVLLVAAQCATAQPTNDQWATRTVIAALPFAPPALAVADASTEASDPPFFCKLSGAQAGVKTVWYEFTTGASTSYVDVAASGYDSVLAVYTGTPAAGFEQVAGGCNDDGGASRSARIFGLRLAPQTSYSFVVAAANDAVAANSLAFSLQGSRLYQVTTSADALTGSCATSCTLRDAIGASNLQPGAVLVPPGNYVLTLAGRGENNNATGDLDVRAGMGIHATGEGAVVLDGALADRVLHIDPSDGGAYTVAISGLTLAQGDPGFGDGGALFNDFSSAVPLPTDDYVDLWRVVLDGNRTNLNGGGARLNGIAALVECTVSANSASSSGGGLSFAAPTAQPARWRVARSTVSGNSSLSSFAGGGGGIHAVSLAGTLESSTVSGNTSQFGGGGVLVTQQGSLVIRDSTIASNLAGTNGGGGVRHEGVSVAISNSALAGNEFGGGSVTFTQDCSAASPTAPFVGNYVASETLCPFTAGSNNLEGGIGLLSLADNGGPTLTRLPAAGSILIDSGPPTCLARDQRGTPRPQDGGGATIACDRGAVEVSLASVDAIFRDDFE